MKLKLTQGSILYNKKKSLLLSYLKLLAAVFLVFFSNLFFAYAGDTEFSFPPIKDESILQPVPQIKRQSDFLTESQIRLQAEQQIEQLKKSVQMDISAQKSVHKPVMVSSEAGASDGNGSGILAPLSQTLISDFFNKMINTVFEGGNSLWLTIESKVPEIKELNRLITFPAKVTLLVFFVFLTLVYFFRKTEGNFIEVAQRRPETGSKIEQLSSSVPLFEPSNEKKSSADEIVSGEVKNELSVVKKEVIPVVKNIVLNVIKEESREKISHEHEAVVEAGSKRSNNISTDIVESFNVVPNQVKINKFLNPGQV